MISTTKNEATEVFLGRDASEGDAERFWEAFSGGKYKAAAHHDTTEQRDVGAYLAYQQLGWDWPFDKPEGV